mmetsp:Transcript_24705/g.44627  ORF Transcript_24705/g.44627 Transcript_24705/m.44627 type:complete len:80 (+) Transcript_24705:145-384(+)
MEDKEVIASHQQHQKQQQQQQQQHASTNFEEEEDLIGQTQTIIKIILPHWEMLTKMDSIVSQLLFNHQYETTATTSYPH